MKILIVDDIHYNLALLDRILKSLGHHVVKTHNCKDAMKVLETNNDIQMVITDYALLGETGFDLKKMCHQKLRIELGRKMPHFVLLSAYASDDIINKAKRNGFIEVLHKPITVEYVTTFFDNLESGNITKESIKKVLVFAPDQLIQEAIQKCLPEENLCIFWFSDLIQALDCYKNQPDLTAIFCSQVCRGTSALDLIELCKSYKLFYDNGIVKQPTFHVVMNHTTASEEEIESFITDANALKVDDILYFPISTNKIRQIFNIPLNAEIEQIENATGDKILIIEDTAITRLMLEKVLRKSGYKVVSSETGYDALRHLREDPDIKLVLCDLHLPDMQGDEILQQYEEMRQLSTDTTCQSADFVLMTMSKPETIPDVVFEKNFAQVIHKPLNMVELDDIIETILRRPEARE